MNDRRRPAMNSPLAPADLAAGVVQLVDVAVRVGRGESRVALLELAERTTRDTTWDVDLRLQRCEVLYRLGERYFAVGKLGAAQASYKEVVDIARGRGLLGR